MQYILILLLFILALYFVTSYFNKKELDLKHQLIASQRHNYLLKKELSKYNCKKTAEIRFSRPESSVGILNENSKLYLCPIEDSILIYSNKEKLQVKLIDECLFNNLIWYYVDLPTASNINCRGWVQKNSFSILCNDIKNIPDNI